MSEMKYQKGMSAAKFNDCYKFDDGELARHSWCILQNCYAPVNNCGMYCCDYSPRNGKSGCCRHYRKYYIEKLEIEDYNAAFDGPQRDKERLELIRENATMICLGGHSDEEYDTVLNKHRDGSWEYSYYEDGEAKTKVLPDFNAAIDAAGEPELADTD